MRLGGLKRTLFPLIVISLLIAFPAGVMGGESFRLYPVPLLEMEKILSNWMHESGYVVYRSGPSELPIQLSGIRGNERWNIILQSHSPLFSSIKAEHVLNSRTNSQRIGALWAFLDDYVAKNASVEEKADTEISTFLFPTDSIVCLKAFSGKVPIHFSGSVVDKNGIILSTAHDLEKVRKVTVVLSDGRNLPGRLVKRDIHRDLSLIRVESRFASSLNLNEGRNLLNAGEKIYAPTCSDGVRIILSGRITGPVKPSEDLLLLQVDMNVPRGSSGSPVFDSEGKIVAMIKGRYRGNPSIGFLIPLDTVVEFLNEK
jgi:serine protease Do